MLPVQDLPTSISHSGLIGSKRYWRCCPPWECWYSRGKTATKRCSFFLSSPSAFPLRRHWQVPRCNLSMYRRMSSIKNLNISKATSNSHRKPTTWTVWMKSTSLPVKISLQKAFSRIPRPSPTWESTIFRRLNNSIIRHRVSAPITVSLMWT